MAIYTRKYMLESAADDLTAAETIDNIEAEVSDEVLGIDPVDIENNDVELPEEKAAALSTEVINPVEECYAMMFEEEYNYNSIMRAIGMYELNEAAHGREVLYEAVDVKGFFKRIYDFFANAAKNAAEAIMKIIGDLKSKAVAKKNFMKAENKRLIELGWSDLDKLVYDIDPEKISGGDKTRIAKIIAGNVGWNDDFTTEKLRADKIEIAKEYGLDISDPEKADATKKFKKDILGDKVLVSKATHITLQSVIGEMESSNNIKKVNEAYKGCKKLYMEIMSNLKKQEKEYMAKAASKSEDRIDGNKGLAAVNYNVSRIRFAQSLERSHIMAVIHACVISDVQTISLASAAARKGEAKDKKDTKEYTNSKKSKPEIQHNSATIYRDTFSNINFL